VRTERRDEKWDEGFTFRSTSGVAAITSSLVIESERVSEKADVFSHSPTELQEGTTMRTCCTAGSFWFIESACWHVSLPGFTMRGGCSVPVQGRAPGTPCLFFQKESKIENLNLRIFNVMLIKHFGAFPGTAL
jgi:hypothetical protein